MKKYNTFRAENLNSIEDGKGLILDVRTDMEHADKHLSCPHLHIPLDELRPSDVMRSRGLGQDSNVYILCRSGKRAEQAAERFGSEGYNNIHVIEGGIIACENCGHLLQGHGCQNERSRKTGPIPLERQVRIAAGALVASGAVLGLLVNPLFILISLFVGCGLIFAGITDRCGMALILTKAPWNKISK